MGAGQVLQNVYVSVFGLVIFLADVRSSWANAFFGSQRILFQYCHFLATSVGRAIFFVYVGLIILFMLPESDTWKAIYIILGGLLCGCALIMLVLRFCKCTKDSGAPSG